MSAEKLYSIRLIFADDQKGGVTPIGGAAWLTQDEQMKAWGAVPKLHEAHDTSFFAELLDVDDDVLDDMPVSAQTCERLMGKPIAELIAAGRAKTAYTVEDFFKRDPSLRASFPALSAATPA